MVGALQHTAHSLSTPNSTPERCPYDGGTLAEQNEARGARDYNGNAVCWDCYVRLCEDAHQYAQAEEGTHV